MTPMFTAYIVVTVLTAAANLYAAASDFTRPKWILDTMTRLKVPDSTLTMLGILKAAGALGLLAGMAAPLIGAVAAVGLALFFAGAVVTAIRAKWYAHIPYPVAWLLLAVAALVLEQYARGPMAWAM